MEERTKRTRIVSLVQKACAAWDTGNINEALSAFEAGIDLGHRLRDPKTKSFFHGMIGSLYFRLCDQQKALRHRKAAVRCDPCNMVGRLALVQSYLALRKRSNAMKELKRILSMKNLDAHLTVKALNIQGIFYLDMGKNRLALKSLQRAIPLLRATDMPVAARDDWSGWLITFAGNTTDLAWELVKRRMHLEEAIEYLERAIKCSGILHRDRIRNNWFYLAEAYELSGRIEQAIWAWCRFLTVVSTDEEKEIAQKRIHSLTEFMSSGESGVDG